MKVILYTKENCPKCRVLKTKLDRKNIQYTEITDIELMLSLGLQSAPALKVDEVLMEYSEANKWVNEQEAWN